ncbi:MAG TPA: GHMP kinase [Bacteroides sp.]|nr:GHMP kinase [Bacteroides sp.]
MEEPVYRYYSNGKLLITGEYLVLQGAKSLSLPTRAGQFLYVYKAAGGGLLHWTAKVLGAPWFQCTLDIGSWTVQDTDNEKLTVNLINLLKAASDLKGNTNWLEGISAVSEIGFDIDWGLGSSSSLISNIAWWAEVDPFKLFRLTSSGSGYDVASARSEGPILYSTGIPAPVITEVNFHPDFTDHLAFVYLGRKQDSSVSVKNFLNNALVRDKDLDRITEISEAVVVAGRLEDYTQLLLEHEQILGKILDRPPVKDVLFRDYPGMVKSLGAWGGDFVHVSFESGQESAMGYFREKGLEIFIPYDEMIKSVSNER